MEKSHTRVTVALTGINGYGTLYLNHILDHGQELGVDLVGVIDPEASRNERFGELQEAGIPSFDRLEEFYKANSAQLVVISAPIQYHLPFTREAVNNGSNVLCEKPLAATAEQAREFKLLDEQSSPFIAIGYQWSFLLHFLNTNCLSHSGIHAANDVFSPAYRTDSILQFFQVILVRVSIHSFRTVFEASTNNRVILLVVIDIGIFEFQVKERASSITHGMGRIKENIGLPIRL